jgi:hypothetical protein
MVLSMQCVISAQWKKIPSPFENQSDIERFGEMHPYVFSQDTILLLTELHETKQSVLFRTFNRGITWDSISMPLNLKVLDENKLTSEDTNKIVFIVRTGLNFSI